MAASDINRTPRSEVRRIPSRGAYDRETINAILDEALICHVGFVDDGQPFVMPTIHARMGDRLILHGAKASRMLRRLCAGAPACVTVTLLDGLVLARSAFHHSMNYRSVVVLGVVEEITDPRTKDEALEALVEHVVPGRWNDARRPSDAELSGTTVVAMPISEASAKIRSGPPSDDEDDYALPVWAGVIPLALTGGELEPDPLLRDGIAVPPYVAEYRRP